MGAMKVSCRTRGTRSLFPRLSVLRGTTMSGINPWALGHLVGRHGLTDPLNG